MKRVHSLFLLSALSVVACGGDDDASSGGMAGSGGGGGETAASGAGTAGKGGEAAGASGKSAGGTATGGSSAGSSMTGTSGTATSGDCELEAAVVSCEVDSGGGVRICTEVYLTGTPEQVTRDSCGGTVREGEHCPDGPNLVGFCKGGISTYYYAPPDNNVWTSVNQSCPALMGTWCGS